jgi:hypothetical protein
MWSGSGMVCIHDLCCDRVRSVPSLKPHTHCGVHLCHKVCWNVKENSISMLLDIDWAVLIALALWLDFVHCLINKQYLRKMTFQRRFAVGRPACSLVTILTMLSHVHRIHIGNCNNNKPLSLHLNRGLKETAQWGSWWSVLRTKYYLGDRIKKNEMGGACGTYGGEERCIQGYAGETWGKETIWKTQA